MREVIRVTSTTHLWRFFKNGVEQKVPLPLLTDEHLLNAHHLLRRKKADLELNLKEPQVTFEFTEPEYEEDQRKSLAWCILWVDRFNREIAKRKIQELPLLIRGGEKNFKRGVNTLFIKDFVKDDQDILILMRNNAK